MNNISQPFPFVNSIDLFRISKAKEVADCAPNTIRGYAKKFGLRIYYNGGAAWVSKSELEACIRANSKTSPGPRGKKGGAE